MEAADLSPEQLGKRLGVSGMTLRRWKAHPPAGELPKIYEKALIGVIHELVGEGKLTTTHPVVQAVMTTNQWDPMTTAVAALGIEPATLKGGVANEKRLMENLSQIGLKGTNKSEVDRNKSRIMSFKKMGAEWGRRVTSLWKVVTSAELNTMDKLVAYGALFYLICPFDLIPDWIPVFGYMDDYIVLGFAVAYYMKRFPQLFESIQEK
jgi:uncharacterized membrane protein YkvA (DUF1232 family)